ncbi:hypothetical protein UPYG_G00120750 [Umbra pygmaea]|uniref:C2H2-type domain-containing protein n=1 Tax=Umbra pygmaea TaxID=75934 RepID=A0ABD0XUI5_UMBPY
MENRTLLPAEDPKQTLMPLLLRTEPDTKTHRVRGEDISDVPIKVPKFQYVDFPSLHRCIQQLTVPPLDSWRQDCPLGKPFGGHPSATSKERMPHFKYVDYPSLHRCIRQLSVPPLESWSSGLARPGHVATEVPGSTTSQPFAVSGKRAGHGGGSASVHKSDQYTAFPFPGPDPGSIQCLGSSKRARRKPQQHWSSPPDVMPDVGSQRDGGHHKVVCSDRLSKFTSPKTWVSGIKCVSGVGPVRQSHMNPVGDDWHVDIEQSPQSIHKAHVEVSDCPDLGQGFWGTLPESVCPFCQKMFSDPEELRIHQKSHREKKPH